MKKLLIISILIICSCQSNQNSFNSVNSIGILIILLFSRFIISKLVILEKYKHSLLIEAPMLVGEHLRSFLTSREF